MNVKSLNISEVNNDEKKKYTSFNLVNFINIFSCP